MIYFDIKNPDLDRLKTELVQAGFSVSKKHFRLNTIDFDIDISFSYNKVPITIWKFGERRYNHTVNISSFKKFITIENDIISIDLDSIKTQIDENNKKKKELRQNKNVAEFNRNLMKVLIEGQLSENSISFDEVSHFATNRLYYSISFHGINTNISFTFKSLEDMGNASLENLKVNIFGCSLLFDEFINRCVEYAEKKLPEYVPDSKIVDDCNKNIGELQNKIYRLNSEIYGLEHSKEMFERKLTNELNKPLSTFVAKLKKKAKP